MDLITHGLFALSIGKLLKTLNKFLIISIICGALIPDIGEVFIQMELSKKYNTILGVYDERTSDLVVAADISVTIVYDFLHSITFPLSLFILSLFISLKNKSRKILQFFSLGSASHILIDSFTHGHVWALKLFYPFVNRRFKIFPDLIGNWWDWTPKVNIYFIKIPILCIAIWIMLLIYIYWKDRSINK